ncbi:MAG TPA: SPOR domain-containing protein [Acidobacteriaceae bacterium]
MTRPLDEDDLRVRGYSGQRLSEPDSADREISLGTPTILGIFFALALLCACFFGFGYTMGRKSAQATPIAIPSGEGVAAAGSNTPKPAAGSLAGHPNILAPQPVSDTSTPPAAQTAVVPLTSSSAVTPADRAIAGEKLPAATLQPAVASLPSATAFFVQVAAVSSQDVADILLASLQKKGYTVAVHHEPQDKLLHVQIGPFAEKKEAEAMRQRVLADGFNAIVK